MCGSPVKEGLVSRCLFTPYINYINTMYININVYINTTVQDNESYLCENVYMYACIYIYEQSTFK